MIEHSVQGGRGRGIALAYTLLGGVWSLFSLISLNHIFKFFAVPFLSVTLLGWMAWAAIVFTLVLLSYCYWRQAFIVFVLFFSFGAWFGPFLEPPSDPLEHLRRTYTFCDKIADELPDKNLGFWHYSMSAVLLCSDSDRRDPDTTIFTINILHGIYQGLLIVALFVLGKSIGLPDRWAFLSCCISFLFFGTNRFSYFSYYSLAPTFSSMMMYWLWTALFFCRKSWFALVTGVFSAILLIPVLWINHVQEVFLLGLLVMIWLFLNFHEHIWQYSGKIRLFYLLGTVFVLFLLPQWSSFQDFFSSVFVRNLWEENQRVVFTWMDFHLSGKVWSFRIFDTFLYIGGLVLLLALPFFWPGFIRKSSEKKRRVFLLAIIPFIGYCVPLIHFVWASNVFVRDYWRLCYASMFWLFFSFLFWGLEGRVIVAAKKIYGRFVT